MIAGMDGTSEGWVMVVCDDNLGHPRALFVNRLVELQRDLRVVAVDVPIGLPQSGARVADILARRALGKARSSSVFPCPVRPALGASSWTEACALTERADGRRVSKQTFAILPKIAEADAFVRSDPWAHRTIHEVHPELSFAKWSGAPMVHGKKSLLGREERLRLIATTFGSGVFEDVRQSLHSHHVGWDDLADAFAAVWTASRILVDKAKRFPEERVVDAQGVPMQIWA